MARAKACPPCGLRRRGAVCMTFPLGKPVSPLSGDGCELHRLRRGALHPTPRRSPLVHQRHTPGSRERRLLPAVTHPTHFFSSLLEERGYVSAFPESEDPEPRFGFRRRSEERGDLRRGLPLALVGQPEGPEMHPDARCGFEIAESL